MFIRPELGGKVQDVYFSLHTVLLVHKETAGTRLSGTKRYKTLALSNAPLVSKLVREGFLSSMYQVRATRISGSLRHPSTGTAQRYMTGATLSRFHKKG